MNSNQNECMNPEDRWFTEGPYMLNNRTLHSPSDLKLKPWKFKVDGAINGKGGRVGGGGERGGGSLFATIYGMQISEGFIRHNSSNHTQPSQS